MHHPQRIILFFVVLFIVVGLWSSKALPGSVFYQYKTSINDPLIKFLHFTKDRKGGFEVGLVERRLAEAVTLIRQQKFTDEAYTAWQRALMDNVYALTRRIAGMETPGSILLGHALATQEYAVLQGYTTALPLLELPNSDVEKVQNAIKQYITDAERATRHTQERTLKLIDKQFYLPEIDGRVAETVVYANGTKTLIPLVEADVTKDVYVGFTRMQESVEKQIFDAKEMRARDFYPEAMLGIQNAHATARQLRIMVELIEG